MVRKYSPGELSEVKVTMAKSFSFYPFFFQLKIEKRHARVKDHGVHSEIDAVKSIASQGHEGNTWSPSQNGTLRRYQSECWTMSPPVKFIERTFGLPQLILANFVLVLWLK